MKKFITAILISALTLSTLTGCGNVADSDNSASSGQKSFAHPHGAEPDID